MLSQIISAIRPARQSEKAGAVLAGVSSGRDVALPYQQAGWVNITDSQYTQAAPRSIIAGTRAQITIDGLGAATNRAFAAGLGLDVWSGDRFRPAAMGEAYNLRLTLTIAKSTSSGGDYAQIEADIGTDAAPFISAAQSLPLVKASGAPTIATISAPFFYLDTFGRNGARIFITPSVDVTIWGAAIFIQRTFQP